MKTMSIKILKIKKSEPYFVLEKSKYFGNYFYTILDHLTA